MANNLMLIQDLTVDLRCEKYIPLRVTLLTLIVHLLLWQAWPPHLGPDGSAYLIYYLDLTENQSAPIQFTT